MELGLGFEPAPLDFLNKHFTTEAIDIVNKLLFVDHLRFLYMLRYDANHRNALQVFSSPTPTFTLHVTMNNCRKTPRSPFTFKAAKKFSAATDLYFPEKQNGNLWS